MIKFLLFMLLTLGLMSCKTQSAMNVTPQISMNLQITPNYNGSPLIMYKTYSFNGKPIQFTRFSFILSRLCGGTTTDCQNRQTQFDFSLYNDSISAVNGIINTIQIDPAGLQNLLIGFGVDINSNSIIPAQQSQSSPLSNGLNYWDAWNSFIFLKVEGMYDKDGDGVFETPFALHTGGNQIYSEKKYFLNNDAINLNASSTRVLFNVNLASIISGIDFTLTTQTHKTGDLPLMQTMMTNFQSALIFKSVTSK